MSEILSRLLFEKNIKVTELARLTEVPQPTIQRIVAGTTSRPHLNTLEPIAHFFSITVNQLRGLESIPFLKLAGTKEPALRTVPILSWKQVSDWLELPAQDRTRFTSESMSTDAKTGERAYALMIKDASMEPVFSIGTSIIIDPDKEPKDRSYVVVKPNSYPEAILRQLIIDMNTYYIKPLSPELIAFNMQLLNKDDKICGVLVQAKRNFND
ncbi:MAG: repressor protein [Gammaproteobacteria bacterium]|nr:repressor protein [Gammaproteobacteria bacterium]